MNKRGLSDVVTTVIIVALAIVAIAVVWVAIQNLILNNTESITSSAYFLKLNYKFESAKNDSGNLFVVVKRNGGDGNFNAMKFTVIYKNSSSESFIENGSFGILETKGYSLPISGQFSDLSKIEGYPAVISDSGKLTVSSMHFDYNLAGFDFEKNEVINLTKGLILYLPFSFGEPLVDKSGNGNDAVNHGATWTSNGKIGGAYEFDGNYLSVPDNFASIIGEGSFTISLWYKGLQSSTFIGLAGSTPSVYHGYAIENSDGHLRSWINNDIHTGNTYINDNKWHYLVILREGDIGRLYVDGTKDLPDYNTSKGTLDSSVKSFWIGGWGSVGYLSNGTIDEVRLYNRALTDSEVKKLSL